MSKDFDEFVDELQGRIYEEARENYGEVAFNRWLNPKYMGELEQANGHSSLTGRCGDTMEVFLRFEDDRVKEASFKTDGCASSVACGSFAVEMALGKDPDELLDITGEAILEIIGGLPEEDRHCAFLASEALQGALNDYMINNYKSL